MNKQKCLILTSGECVLIAGEDSKYFYADGRQFRKMSHQIMSIEEAEVPCAKETTEEEAAKPKPTRIKQKKKPAEEKQTLEE